MPSDRFGAGNHCALMLTMPPRNTSRLKASFTVSLARPGLEVFLHFPVGNRSDKQEEEVLLRTGQVLRLVERRQALEQRAWKFRGERFERTKSANASDTSCWLPEAVGKRFRSTENGAHYDIPRHPTCPFVLI